MRTASLRELRQLANLTQAQVADRLGWPQEELSSWERAPIGARSLTGLEAYVEALGGSLRAEVVFPGGPTVTLLGEDKLAKATAAAVEAWAARARASFGDEAYTSAVAYWRGRFAQDDLSDPTGVRDSLGVTPEPDGGVTQ